MAFRRMAASILAEWRAIERELLLIPRGSPDALRLHDELERLRDEYDRLYGDAADDLRQENRPDDSDDAAPP